MVGILNNISYLCEYKFNKMAYIKSKTKEYKTWKGMKSRCYSPSAVAGKYKENNIQVCDEWKNSFEKFHEDMGDVPEGMTLERKNVLGNYCKENCIWADFSTQAKNRGSFNEIITYNGETKVLKDWAKHFDIKYTTLYQRMHRNNLSFEQAIQSDPYERQIEIDDKQMTLKEWCKFYDIKYSTVVTRINKHKWPIEEALKTPHGVRRTLKN